jgi:hypothetical protein
MLVQSRAAKLLWSLVPADHHSWACEAAVCLQQCQSFTTAARGGEVVAAGRTVTVNFVISATITADADIPNVRGQGLFMSCVVLCRAVLCCAVSYVMLLTGGRAVGLPGPCSAACAVSQGALAAG